MLGLVTPKDPIILSTGIYLEGLGDAGYDGLDDQIPEKRLWDAKKWSSSLIACCWGGSPEVNTTNIYHFMQIVT